MYMHKLTQTVITGHDKAVVQTKAGKVRGAIVEGNYIFRGVKYADAERFHMPHDVEPWEGVKEALVYGYNPPELNTVLAHDEPYVPHYFWPENEHCQYVNIWTKSIDPSAKKPVMVWMHGGGWMGGSSVEIYSYDGENLAEYGDVVVVSLNHRLNVLGYLDLSNYGEEYKNSVNVGLADLVAALKWIHENIENFGGDPGNVTIMGQSGGGGKVLSMLQTPAADGLFHKAIMQSGGARLGFDPNARKTNQEFADMIVKNLGLTKETIKQIETVSWYDLSAATIKAIWQCQQEGKGRPSWGPISDGEYYFGNPAEYGWREESKHIPMIVGSNMGEFKCYAAFELEKSKNCLTDEEADKLLTEELGDKKDAVVEAFKKAYPDHKVIDAIYTDTSMRSSLIAFCKDRAKNTDTPIYEYMFSFESDWDGGFPAWHNAEEPFMFHNARYIESAFVPGESDKLEDAVASSWLAFAKTGNPNNALIPEWKPVDKDSNIMIFDRTIRSEVNFDDELMGAYPPPKPMGFPGSTKMFSVYGADLEI